MITNNCLSGRQIALIIIFRSRICPRVNETFKHRVYKRPFTLILVPKQMLNLSAGKTYCNFEQ